jgi:glucose dehydrogenase
MKVPLMVPFGGSGKRVRIIACAIAFASLACGSEESQSRTAGSESRVPGGAVGSAAQATGYPEDGEWHIPAKNYASTRFSGLDQITTENEVEGGLDESQGGDDR